jgi:predicted permease
VLARAIILPIVTFVTLLFFSELTTELKSYLLQQSGIPAAISIAIFAQKYQYYESRFAGIVILSSLVSFLLLGILYFLFSIIK